MTAIFSLRENISRHGWILVEFLGNQNEYLHFASQFGKQKQKRKDGELEVHWKKVVSSKTVGCPACSAQALLNGNEVSESEPRLEGDEVVIESVLLPSKFECYTCGLEIEGYGKLNAAGLGGQYTYEFREDATEHYANREEFDGWDAYDAYDAYGND